jgi:hypothetical protein
MCVYSFVLSVGWPLDDIPVLHRPLQAVSRGSLIVISNCSGYSGLSKLTSRLPYFFSAFFVALGFFGYSSFCSR